MTLELEFSVIIGRYQKFSMIFSPQVIMPTDAQMISMADSLQFKRKIGVFGDCGSELPNDDRRFIVHYDESRNEVGWDQS